MLFILPGKKGKKMEKSRTERNLLIVCLVLGLLAGQSAASFKDCYKSCFILCVITPGKNLVSCAGKCLKDCIIPFSLENLNDTRDFCKLGCASSLCTNLSTRDNPAEEKVESCVDSCSATCLKN
ncbi:thionin-like protein 2 [Melia azedarach]|uniref:Thionin-like protein 2 n=1 Tax=Melia azedarach TaxID=155640 RepID=A0ACC1Y3J1_MELAZ|nr:thionin-like protein 2 [Melia azedarach]